MSRYPALATLAALAALIVGLLIALMGGLVATSGPAFHVAAFIAVALAVGAATGAWWVYGRRGWIGPAATVGAVLMVVAGLRALASSDSQASMGLAAAQLAAALLATALFLYAATEARAASLGTTTARNAAGRDTYPRLALLTTVGTFFLALVTPFLAATAGESPSILQGLDWALITVVGIFAALILYETYQKRPGTGLIPLAWAVVILFAGFAVLGLAPASAAPLPWLHAAFGILLYGASAMLTVDAYRTPAPRPGVPAYRPAGDAVPATLAVNTTPSPAPFTPLSPSGIPAATLIMPQPDATARSLRSTIGVYVTLTKPRIIVLLLITTWAAMWIASPTPPSAWLVLWTMIGGYLAAGGANAINMYMDRDIDRLMGRTARRPLPSQQLEPNKALAFGVTLGVLSFVVMAIFVNLLSAVLSIIGLLFYVFVYTGWLKRTTTQNIVIGGAAGAIPPLVGWAAATGSLSLAAVWLFAIIFYWTPPHFWALALVRQADYARAGVPMLPVVKGEPEAYRQIFLYSILLVAISVMLVPLRAMGYIYLGLALGLGGVFLWYAYKLMREGGHAAAWKLYKYSLLYLALIFAAMVLDHVLLWGLPSALVTILWP